MGVRIRKRREELNLSQTMLAKLLNISRTHMSAIENSTAKPSIDTLCDICDALNTSPDYLLYGNISMNNVYKNIVENLRLCDNEDIEIIGRIIEIYSTKHTKNFR